MCNVKQKVTNERTRQAEINSLIQTREWWLPVGKQSREWAKWVKGHKYMLMEGD